MMPITDSSVSDENDIWVAGPARQVAVEERKSPRALALYRATTPKRRDSNKKTPVLCCPSYFRGVAAGVWSDTFSVRSAGPRGYGRVISADTAVRTGVFYAYTAGAGKTSRLKHGESSGAPSSPPAHQPPQFGQQGQDTVSIARKIAHKAEAVKGSAKRMDGRITGSRRLRTEGRADQAKGNIKQAGAKIKDASGH